MASTILQFKKKKGMKGKRGGKGGRSASAYEYYYAGTAAETNRPRRRDMERLKERRDEFLEKKKDLLLHFLTDNDYFKKKEKREKKGIEKEERKKKEAFSAAAAGIIATEDINGTSNSSLFSGDNAMNNLNDAASAMAALCDIAASDGDACRDTGVDGEVVSLSKLVTDVSEASKDVNDDNSALISSHAKHISWDGPIEEVRVIPISELPLYSSEVILKDEKKTVTETVGEDDDQEDSNIEPMELQVSYAMRGVPLVPQPPTLIAELHEHQV